MEKHIVEELALEALEALERAEVEETQSHAVWVWIQERKSPAPTYWEVSYGLRRLSNRGKVLKHAHLSWVRFRLSPSERRTRGLPADPYARLQARRDQEYREYLSIWSRKSNQEVAQLTLNALLSLRKEGIEAASLDEIGPLVADAAGALYPPHPGSLQRAAVLLARQGLTVYQSPGRYELTSLALELYAHRLE